MADQQQPKARKRPAEAFNDTPDMRSMRILPPMRPAPAMPRVERKPAAPRVDANEASAEVMQEMQAERDDRKKREAMGKAYEEATRESFNPKAPGNKAGGKISRYAKGGAVSASRRADGVAQRGKTRGRMC